MSHAALAVSLLAVVLAACDSAPKPEDPVWGKQACGSCAMLVSDPRFAAQLVTEGGARVFFDDVGCMAEYVAEHPAAPARMWVRSAAGAWVDARTARFKAGAHTPMDYGFVHAPDGDVDLAGVEQAVRARKEERR